MKHKGYIFAVLWALICGVCFGGIFGYMHRNDLPRTVIIYDRSNKEVVEYDATLEWKEDAIHIYDATVIHKEDVSHKVE